MREQQQGSLLHIYYYYISHFITFGFWTSPSINTKPLTSLITGLQTSDVDVVE